MLFLLKVFSSLLNNDYIMLYCKIVYGFYFICKYSTLYHSIVVLHYVVQDCVCTTYILFYYTIL